MTERVHSEKHGTIRKRPREGESAMLIAVQFIVVIDTIVSLLLMVAVRHVTYLEKRAALMTK